MSFWAYMLRCSNGAYYAGHSDDLETRLAAHQMGSVGGYTSKHRPVKLVWFQEFPDRDSAFAAERQIKGWSRVKKEALIAGDWDGVQVLTRKLFLRYAGSASSPATQDERDDDDQGDTPNPLILSSGLSEAEGRVSKEGAVSKEGSVSEEDKGPIIILVRPQLGQNIGKAARAMLNFGLTELRLVAPRDGWPNPDAGPAAAGADMVLATARVFATVEEAIADCAIVYASTVRRRDLTKPAVGPEEMARDIHASGERTAILFGPERSGLESDDVALATRIVTVPINPEFGSLNLAQAVILLAYEWSRGSALALAQPTVKDLEPPAPQGELEGLIAHLDADLHAAGYFHPPERTQVTRHMIRSVMSKPRWSSREVKAVRGMIRTLGKPRPRGSLTPPE